MPITQLIIAPPGIVGRHIKINRWWIFSVIVVITILILGSATLFWYFESSAQDAAATRGSPHFGWFDSFYFTVINITTVGFGDIAPKTTTGRWISMANAILGLLIFGWLVAVITIALQPSGPTSTPAVKIEVDRELLEAMLEALPRDRDTRRTREGSDRPRRRFIVELEE